MPLAVLGAMGSIFPALLKGLEEAACGFDRQMLQRQGKGVASEVEPPVSHRRGTRGKMDGACPGPTILKMGL